MKWGDGLLGLLFLEVCLPAQESPETSFKESAVLWLLVWPGMFWGPK